MHLPPLFVLHEHRGLSPDLMLSGGTGYTFSFFDHILISWFYLLFGYAHPHPGKSVSLKCQ
jgi:hypothetical protein